MIGDFDEITLGPEAIEWYCQLNLVRKEDY
jgi:hypothetical protein